MGLIVAIEPDPKSAKDLTSSCGEVAKLLTHELLVLNSINDIKSESPTGEPIPTPTIDLLIIPIEDLGKNPIDYMLELRKKFSCNIIVTLFDDASRPFKKIDFWPVMNFIYKPFDLTILKEHTRFALLKNTKIKTEFVHTTNQKGEIERLTKMECLHLSETGFKVSKTRELNVGQIYKFYHPMFLNGRNQHVWARLVYTDDMSHEFIFSEVTASILTQIRKRVNSGLKVKNAVWRGRESNNFDQLNVMVQLADPEQIQLIQDLLQRNYDGLVFKDAATIKIDKKNEADVIITDVEYKQDEFDTMFEPGTTNISITKEVLDRAKTEKRFTIDTIRMEKAIDKSFLVKILKQLFPKLKEKEPTPVATCGFLETITLTEIMPITEMSEASIGFKLPTALTYGTGIDICLPQEDETSMKEMKARVHYVDEQPDSEKFYYHQLVLFGMKDEFLKLLRLWGLEKHILANKAE